ncbi:hypothetical protein L6452_26508 [Arctium lappa]|uniref:Uncharacterized protein n=1 Tax=Arctium lappa TaxID=4217 RepID=A0ACB8ZUT8_ARCLA|nr:hypothetical protein L6452_26508 [Arctium lappa]
MQITKKKKKMKTKMILVLVVLLVYAINVHNVDAGIASGFTKICGQGGKICREIGGSGHDISRKLQNCRLPCARVKPLSSACIFACLKG